MEDTAVTVATKTLRALAVALLWLCALPAFAAEGHGTGPDTARVRVITLDGAIGPAFADYLRREIHRAPESGTDLLVIAMNTPGGLVSSTRSMIQDILASPVPIAVYVSPQGAHAASAGTYILYASHVAAMAPGTNLGAATPIEMGGDSPSKEKPGDDEKIKESKPAAPEGAADRKAVNDAVSLIRSLADMRGRNAEWAEKAVREAASLTAKEALDQHVIEVIASDMQDLLQKIDGRDVTVGDVKRSLATKTALVEEAKMGWTTQLLMMITDPNVAFILMTLGMYGLIFELSNPGAVLPGLLGAVSLLIGLYALSVLPVTAAGAALLLLGVGFMIGEAINPGIGALGVSGLICFALGALLLIDTDVPQFRIAWEVALGATAVSGAFLLFIVAYALGVQRRPATTGREDLIGARVTVLEWQNGEGFVHAKGERWRARASQPLVPGASVVVRNVDGLTLEVVPFSDIGRE